MKLHKLIPVALFSGLLFMGLTACEKGPAEKAGEAIDETASDAAEATEEAVESVQEQMDQ
jgi:hypothetical protein